MSIDEVIPLSDRVRVQEWFPKAVDFEILKTGNGMYNCHAYAFGINTRWVNCQGSNSVLYEYCEDNGYEPLDQFNVEVVPGLQKIVFYADKYENILHTALQRPDGRWESKLGSGPLIIHKTLDCLSGPRYGQPWAVYARPIATAA